MVMTADEIALAIQGKMKGRAIATKPLSEKKARNYRRTRCSFCGKLTKNDYVHGLTCIQNPNRTLMSVTPCTKCKVNIDARSLNSHESTCDGKAWFALFTMFKRTRAKMHLAGIPFESIKWTIEDEIDFRKFDLLKLPGGDLKKLDAAVTKYYEYSKASLKARKNKVPRKVVSTIPAKPANVSTSDHVAGNDNGNLEAVAVTVISEVENGIDFDIEKLVWDMRQHFEVNDDFLDWVLLTGRLKPKS